jgi:hypothetical protein
MQQHIQNPIFVLRMLPENEKERKGGIVSMNDVLKIYKYYQ